MRRLVAVAAVLATLPACINLFFAGEHVCFNDLPVTDFSWTHPERQDSLQFVSETMVQLTRADGSTVDIELGESSTVEDSTECHAVRPMGFLRRSAEVRLPESGLGDFRLILSAGPGSRFVGQPGASAEVFTSDTPYVATATVDVLAEVSDDQQQLRFALDIPSITVDVEDVPRVYQNLSVTFEWELELPSGETIQESRLVTVLSDCSQSKGTCEFREVIPPSPCI